MSGAEVITVERRRRWSLADKRRIVGEALAPGGSVNAVARRHELHASQLFAWCKAAREGLLDDPTSVVAAGRGFAPVVVEDKPSAPMPAVSSPSPLSGRMEIVLSNGHRVVVDASVDVAALGRVLEVLERQ
jgi:transposase